jgi:hypothetical protein
MIILVTYGKSLSIAIGIILTLLLSIHIIRIYFNKGNSRKIQLYLMDIHLACSIPFFINIIIDGLTNSFLDYFFIFLRFAILLAEIIFIYILTDEKFIEQGIRHSLV